MTSYLITGANRGLGLALVANLSSQPNSLVFAAARKSSPELKKLVDDADGRIAPVDVEVTKPVSIAAAVEVVQKHLGDRGLDILINNAGMSSFSAGGTPAMEDLGDVLDVNVVSVQRMTKAFLPLLRQGSEKKVVNMQVTSPIYMPDLTDRSHSTSTLGSIAMAPFFSFAPAPAYKISKAALNMLTVQYAQDLGKEGFIFLPISPGYLKTDMSGPGADLTAEVGAQAVVEIVVKADRNSNGKFQNIHVQGWENVDSVNKYDGKSPPW